jgi:hypothetical protein
MPKRNTVPVPEGDCCDFWAASDRYTPGKEYMRQLYADLIRISSKDGKQTIRELRDFALRD